MKTLCYKTPVKIIPPEGVNIQYVLLKKSVKTTPGMDTYAQRVWIPLHKDADSAAQGCGYCANVGTAAQRCKYCHMQV
jgi:hypothetical protein